MLNVKVILGSTRPSRFSEKLMPWISAELAKIPELTAEVLDLRDYPLPLYDQAITPSQVKDGDYPDPKAREWAAKIREADAFIVIAPEYNRGYTAVLKTAFDAVYAEWNNKPIGFVAYGNVGGARAVEQLRLVSVELQMAPIRAAVHIQAPWFLLDESGALKAGSLDPYTAPLQNMLAQLSWWGNALKAARDGK